MQEAEVRGLLKKFGFDQNEVIQLNIEHVSEPAFAIEVIGGEGNVLWQIFRYQIAEIGMWPVQYASWGQEKGSWREALLQDGTFSRYSYRIESKYGLWPIFPQDILALTRNNDISLGEHIQDYDKWYTNELEFWIEKELAILNLETDRASLEEEINRLIQSGEINGYIDFQKWLLNWELDRETDLDQSIHTNSDYINWFKPIDQPKALLLLPTQCTWEVLAYIHWYGAESIGTPTVISLLKKWHGKYGAELVGHYGTMLNIRVSKLPQDMDEAFELAIEQAVIAPCTTSLPGISLKDHARSLLHQKEWMLHERP